MKSAFTKEIPGLERIEYTKPEVWIYVSQEGIVEAALNAMVSSAVKASWDEMTGTLDDACKHVYQYLHIDGYEDIDNVYIALLNDRDKTKILYLTANGIKRVDVTE